MGPNTLRKGGVYEFDKETEAEFVRCGLAKYVDDGKSNKRTADHGETAAIDHKAKSSKTKAKTGR